MDLFTIITVLIVLSAVFGYINTRFLKLPDTIGLMVVALIFTLITILAGKLGSDIPEFERRLLERIDLHEVFIEGFLSILLFAGALHTDFDRLRSLRWPILIFATLGVMASTVLVGTIMYGVLNLLALEIPYLHCLLFGALISPTDPIAVLGILKKAGVPHILEAKIVGESLFNDGIGVVIFLTILGVAGSESGTFDVSDTLLLFSKEVFGGILLGLVAGWVAFRLLKSIDNYEIEVIITLAIVLGGYWLATQLHISGPLAMVVAGLMIGHKDFRTTTMSTTTETYVDKFWELMDMLFNAILFVLMGMEIIVLSYDNRWLIAGLLAIPAVLLARYVSLIGPIGVFQKRLNFAPKTGLIMTWGGLRGGISIALALSLTGITSREIILTITYIVVAFSVIVQGLTVGKLVEKLGVRQEG